MKKILILSIIAFFAVIHYPKGLAQSAVPYDGTQDLRPTFMGEVFEFTGGDFDGKRGYLFRIWNRAGVPVELSDIPDRFNQPVEAFLSNGAIYETNGRASFSTAPDRFDVLFEGGTSEILEPSPSGGFTDRPANFIAVTSQSVDQIVFTLRGRTATGSINSAQITQISLGDNAVTGTFDIIGIDLVEDRGNEARFTLTAQNNTNADLSDIVVSVFENSATIDQIRSNAIEIPQIDSGETLTPFPTFTVIGADAGFTTITDLSFAYDDRSSMDGLDLDQSGLRDDVKVLIETIVPEADNARAYALAYAKFAINVYNAQTSEEANSHFTDLENATSCLFRFGNTQDEDILNRILFEISNTNDRLDRRYAARDLVFSTRKTRKFPTNAALRPFCDSLLPAQPN